MKDIGFYPIVGDIITIITRNNSATWSSAAKGKCPNNEKINYPLTGRVTAIEYNTHPAISIEGWGFDLDHVKWEFANKKEECYEIY